MDVQQLCEGSGNQPYILAHCQGCIQVVLATTCTAADVLMAFVHARVLALMTSQDPDSHQVMDLTVTATGHACGLTQHSCFRLMTAPNGSLALLLMP